MHVRIDPATVLTFREREWCRGFLWREGERRVTSHRNLFGYPPMPGWIVRVWEGKRWVGLGGMEIVDGTARGNFTVVRRSHRGRGIGHLILETKLAVCRREGVRVYETRVGETNFPSRRLVEGMGLGLVDQREPIRVYRLCFP
jgi:GNAT superfamily N-acetyltransferase